MSTAPSSFISTSDPIFNQPETDSPWAVVEYGDGRLVLTERYRHLDERRKQTILALMESGHEAAAIALANCGRNGSVHRRCKKGNRAGAHRHTCHLWIDPYCGRPRNLLRCWLRWRDPELRSARQHGIELRGPLGSDMMTVAAKVARWLKDQGISSVFRPVLEPKPKCESVRMVIRSDQSRYSAITEHLHKVTKGAIGYSTSSHYESSPLRTLEWMFASTEAILDACGHLRARLYREWHRKQMTRTCGDFYKETKQEQELTEFIEERDPASDDLHCNCGECDGEMEVIPWQERKTQTIEDIEKEYKHVDWSSCYDPFNDFRRNSHKRNLMTESTEVRQWPSQSVHSPPS